MQIVKLDAIDSTNAYLKRTMRNKAIEDYTVVLAKEQLSGRGQSESTWVSEAGKNLTFSVFRKFEALHAQHHFSLNMIVSLAIIETLKNLKVPDLSIKWPNDILSGNYKVCGILIETALVGNQVKNAILGVGLNVNQTNFISLPSASSLKYLLGKSFDHDEVLQVLLNDLKKEFSCASDFDWDSLREKYESKLFKKDKPATFLLPDGRQEIGFISGISDTGKLLVEFDKKGLSEFDLKELKMIY